MQQTSDIITPYYRLVPDEMFLIIESTGLFCDGRLLALNSYENRVYQVGIEDAEPLITRVYRPGRCTDEQILEEHAFALEIVDSVRGDHDSHVFNFRGRPMGHAPS